MWNSLKNFVSNLWRRANQPIQNKAKPIDWNRQVVQPVQRQVQPVARRVQPVIQRTWQAANRPVQQPRFARPQVRPQAPQIKFAKPQMPQFKLPTTVAKFSDNYNPLDKDFNLDRAVKSLSEKKVSIAPLAGQYAPIVKGIERVTKKKIGLNPKQAGNLGLDLTVRPVMNAVRTIDNEIRQKQGKPLAKFEDKDKIQTIGRKALFGGEGSGSYFFPKEMKTVFGEGDQTYQGQTQSLAEMFGAKGKTAKNIGIVGAPIMLGLDLIPGGGGKDDLAKAIAKSQDAKTIAGLIKKAGQNVDPALVKKLVKETDPKKIGGILDSALIKAPKNVGKVDDLTKEAQKYNNAEEFYQRVAGDTRKKFSDAGIRYRSDYEKFFAENKGQSEQVLDSLNPTGGLFVDYDPASRANMKLGKNITTLDKTLGKSADETITIYRGAPNGQKEIVPGDFITTNKELAKSYTGDGNVISKKVKLSDVLDDLDSPGYGEESIYRPLSQPTAKKPTNVQNQGRKGIKIAQPEVTGSTPRVGQADIPPTTAFQRTDQMPTQKYLPQNLSRPDYTPESRLLTTSKQPTLSEARKIFAKTGEAVDYVNPQRTGKKIFVAGDSGIKQTAEKFVQNAGKKLDAKSVVDQLDLSKAKSQNAFTTGMTDMFRNIERAFGKDNSITENIVRPLDKSKGDFARDVTARLSDLKKNIVDGLGIKKGTKESAAVQMFGEGKISLDDLKKQFGNRAEAIVQADEWFRKSYDELLDEVNAVRAEIYPNNPDKIIPKRSDYYRHFQELSDSLAGGLKNILDNSANVPSEIAGKTEGLKPKAKWLSFAQRRKGDKTTFDAVGGYLNYLNAQSYAKNIDPHIEKLRNVVDELASRDADGKLVNLVTNLRSEVDRLAGKTAKIDRTVEGIFGRKGVQSVNWLNNRVKSNTILANASSAIAQFFNIPNGIADAGVGNSIIGTKNMIKHMLSNDDVYKKSNFLSERFLDKNLTKFDQKILEQPKRFAKWMMMVGDEIGTKLIWNSEYAKFAKQGLPEDKVLQLTDEATRKMVAGRGIGEVPLTIDSKTAQIFIPFQVEVNNMWKVQKEFLDEKRFDKLIKLYVASYVMNQGARQIRGSDVTFDPIQAIQEGFQAYQDEKDKRVGTIKGIGRVAGEVFSNIPGGQYVASSFDQFFPEGMPVGDTKVSKRELFGEGDPTRFGAGPLFTRGITDPLYKVIPAWGGQQIERTLKGVTDYARGYNVSKKGNKTFDISKTPVNAVKSALFGSYSTKEGQDFSNMMARNDAIKTRNTRNLNETEKKIFDAIHSTKPEQKTQYDSLTKAALYLQNNNVLEAERNINLEKQKTGDKIDPLWTLSSDQIKKIFQYQTMPYGGADRKDWKTKNAWYGDFSKKRSQFFDGLPKSQRKEYLEFPDPDAQTEKAMETYYSLPSNKRQDYLEKNPNVQEQWDKMAEYTNNMRSAMGYSKLKAYPKATPQVQAWIDKYLSASKPLRKSLRNSQPDMYQKMASYFDATNLYTINKEGALNQLQGQPDQTSKQNKAISNLARDIYKNADGTYSIVPAGWMQGLENGSGGYGKKKKGVRLSKFKSSSLKRGKVKRVRIKRAKSQKAPTLPTPKIKTMKLAKLSKAPNIKIAKPKKG